MDRSVAQADSFPGTRSNARDGAHVHAAHLFGNAIFCALLILIALVAVPYGTVEPWWQALFESAVFGLAALWLIEGYLSGSYDFSAYRILLPLIALTLFGLLQTVPFGSEATAPLKSGVRVWRALSADPHGTRQWVSEMLALILVGAMLLRYTFSRRRLRILIYLVIGLAVASALFGLLRKTTQHQAGFILPYLVPGFGYGQFINNNHFAFLMEMALGLVLGSIVAGRVRLDRLPIYVGLALLLGMSLVISNSRGGILSMLCQLVFIAVLFPSVRPIQEPVISNTGARAWAARASGSLVVRALLILCLVVTVSVGVVWVGGDPLLGRLEAIPGEVSTREESQRWGERRVDIWRATLRLIKAHPIAGVGMGGYWAAIPEYHDASGEFTPQRAHNDYLELLASGGLIGVALGAWFIYVLVRWALKQMRSHERFRCECSFGALVGLSGIAVHSFFDFGLHTTINALIFMVLVVIATVDVCHDEQTPPIRKMR